MFNKYRERVMEPAVVWAGPNGEMVNVSRRTIKKGEMVQMIMSQLPPTIAATNHTIYKGNGRYVHPVATD